MLLETVFNKFKDKSQEEADNSPMIGDYGTAIFNGIKAPSGYMASKHPGSKKPHQAHKRKGRKSHQWHGKGGKR